MEDTLFYLCSIPTILFSLSFHECAHAFAAWKLGDSTAKNAGRLTLNPLKHLDIFGAICMMIFHVGWAKPVPINPRNFKNPKKGMAISSLAGPLSNWLLAFVGLILFTAVTSHMDIQEYNGVLYYSPDKTWQLAVYLLLYYFYSLNLALFVFNFLPIPPFDGSRILLVFLPPKAYFKIMKYERYIMIGLFVFFIASDALYDVTGFDINFISRGMSYVISILEKGMKALISFLPL